jgi:hypothetical protein
MSYSESFLKPGGWTPPNPTQPWGWNPVQTFVDAYNSQQEMAYQKEQMEMERELNQILFPIKQQQAQLSLEKMQLEMERTKGEIERQRILTRQMTEATRNTNQGFNSGLANGTVSRFSPTIYGVGASPTSATGAATTRRVLGKGTITPKTP